MKNCRITRLSKLFIALLVSYSVSVSQAAEILVNSDVIDQAMDVVNQKYQASAEAQEEITRLQNEASSTFEEFKRANDNLESLLVLNAGYRKQISIQEDQIATLDESIAGVEEVTREIPLLMEKMLASIEQYIDLVNIARIGRVALLYQTTDRQQTGAWDNSNRSWVTLDPAEYRTAVQSAIRVASQLDAPRIIELPVLAPEAAQ